MFKLQWILQLQERKTMNGRSVSPPVYNLVPSEPIAVANAHFHCNSGAVPFGLDAEDTHQTFNTTLKFLIANYVYPDSWHSSSDHNCSPKGPTYLLHVWTASAADNSRFSRLSIFNIQKPYSEQVSTAIKKSIFPRAQQFTNMCAFNTKKCFATIMMITMLIDYVLFFSYLLKYIYIVSEKMCSGLNKEMTVRIVNRCVVDRVSKWLSGV